MNSSSNEEKSPWLRKILWTMRSLIRNSQAGPEMMGIFHLLRDFLLLGQAAWPSGPIASLSQLFRNSRDPSFENNRRKTGVFQRPGASRWEKRLRRTGKYVLYKPGDRLRTIAVLLKVPRSLLNGLETIVHEDLSNVKLCYWPCLIYLKRKQFVSGENWTFPAWFVHIFTS